MVYHFSHMKIEHTVNAMADRYIASQLIMISHDSLAQYWEVEPIVSDPLCCANSLRRISVMYPPMLGLILITIFISNIVWIRGQHISHKG